jgi:hypothetical protein
MWPPLVPYLLLLSPVRERTLIAMSFLQGIPETGQLFIFGVGLLVVGVVFRKVRKLIADLRSPIPAPQQVEPRQS